MKRSTLSLLATTALVILGGKALGLYVTETDLVTPKPVMTVFMYAALIYMFYKIEAQITAKVRSLR